MVNVRLVAIVHPALAASYKDGPVMLRAVEGKPVAVDITDIATFLVTAICSVGQDHAGHWKAGKKEVVLMLHSNPAVNYVNFTAMRV